MQVWKEEEYYSLDNWINNTILVTAVRDVPARRHGSPPSQPPLRHTRLGSGAADGGDGGDFNALQVPIQIDAGENTRRKQARNVLEKLGR